MSEQDTDANGLGFRGRGKTDRDRRVNQAERTRRVLSVLQMIRSRGRYNAKTIAAELDCSERTVYRYLDVLELMGVPYFFDENEQCYRVAAGCDLPQLPLSDGDAFGQAVATVLSSNADLGAPGDARAVTRHLESAASDSVRQRLTDASSLLDAFNLQLADHSHCGDAVVAVQHALLGMRQLSGLYVTPYKDKPLRMQLHPYRLCLVKQAWYLVARIEGEDKPKTFRVARFRSLEELPDPSETPADFDLREYFGNAWSVFRGEPTAEVRLWFDKFAAPLVAETRWHRTQQVEPRDDGSAEVEFTVDGLDELADWVLGWAGHVKVLAPVELREMVLERLSAAVEMHKNF